MSKFKLGDRVRVIADSVGGYEGDIGHEGTIINVYSRSNITGDTSWNIFPKTPSGTWVKERDMELITEGDAQVARRTFKLIKDTPTMVKGAILQEQCDDGTQPYIMLNNDTHCKDPSFKISIAKRELVEEQPAFFVEVFKVTPEYMTREELDQWEAFKAKKSVTKKPVAVNSVLSASQERFVKSYEKHNGDLKKVAKELKLARGSVYSIKSQIKKRGVEL